MNENNDLDKELVSSLSKLSPQKFFNTITAAVDNAPESMKLQIKNWINNYYKKDLLTLLPPDLQYKIFHYISGNELLIATQVSKTWFRLITESDYLWKKKCKLLGVNMNKFCEDSNWYKVYCDCYSQLKSYKKKDTYHISEIALQNGLQNGILALDYCDGYICVVSEDSIAQIWILENNIPICKFQVNNLACCVKFDPDVFLVVGHLDGFINIYNLNLVNVVNSLSLKTSFTGYRYKQLRSNGGPIFTVEFSIDLNILVCGAGYSCLIWNLSTGEQLKKLGLFEDWVTKVKLIPRLDESEEQILLINTNKSLKKFVWPVKRKDENAGIVTNKTADIKEVREIESMLVTKNNSDKDLYFFTSQFQISSKYCGYVIHDHANKYNDLVIRELYTFKEVKSLSISFKVIKLLALGDKYALMLAPGHQMFESTIIIYDFFQNKTVGMQHIPHSKMTTPSEDQIVVANKDWLDGLCGLHHHNKIQYHEPVLYNNLYDEDYINSLIEELSFENKHFHPNNEKQYQRMCNLLRVVSKKKRVPNRLILASGIKGRRDTLFTLWWTNENRKNKNQKMD